MNLGSVKWLVAEEIGATRGRKKTMENAFAEALLYVPAVCRLACLHWILRSFLAADPLGWWVRKVRCEKCSRPKG
jgi:hypothetical protein